MIHIQNGEKRQLDMTRFNDAFMMHTSTSPQYGIIASCDVAAAMMEQPAGRALVQETIDEALSFRRAMTAVKKQLKRPRGGSRSGSPTRWRRLRSPTRPRWVLKPATSGTASRTSPTNHVLVDPIKVTILTPGLSPNGTMQKTRHPRRGRGQVPVRPPHRDREDRAVLVPGAVLDGHHQGQMEHAGHRAAQLQGSVRRQRAAQARAAGAGGGASRGLRRDGPEGPVRRRSTRSTATTTCRRRRRTCTRRCRRWRCGRPTPTTSWCTASVESVEIDKLMGRIFAVMVVPYPPGIPVIMTGRAPHQGDQVDPRLPAVRARVRPASSPASRPTSTACASSRSKAAGGATWSTA